MTPSFVDGIALITGAATGIGEETGYAFAEAGALGIVFADINYDRALESAENSKAHATNPKYRALAIKVDIGDPVSVQEMVDFTVNEFQRIDYSINSAGIGATSLLRTSDIDIENFDELLKINTRGVMLCVRAISKIMIAQEPRIYNGRHEKPRSIGRGCIVNVGSGASYIASPNMMAYVASKHALLGITKVAALDHAKHQIRVNAVCPAYVDTPMMQRSIKKLPGLDKMIQHISPLGRMAVPEEVANAIVFLCSPSASYISGTGMIIDAGITVTAHI